MGVISLQCMTANDTRIVGISYTHSLKVDEDYQDNYVALVQSNDSPTSIDTMTWSLISAWPRSLYYPQDYSPMVCHVDPRTGIFTMMSAFNLTDPDYIPDPSIPQRPSGGFQYDPRTSIWSDFTLSNDYLWEDVTDSFAVFTWPGTNTLVQANVGTTTAVSIGAMTTTAKGEHQFVNALNWTLDPLTYGYPTRLVYGNNVLYQFGTVLANNRTGQLNTILTRIPLSGSLETFQPPANLQTFNSSMQECAPGYLSTSFYNDVLYVFCQGTDRSIGPGTGVVMRFKDGPSFRDKSLGPAHMTDIDRLSGAVIQPIGGSNDGKQDPFALVINAVGDWPIQSISLGDNTLGDSNQSDYFINITAPYGDIEVYRPDHSPAIIGGSVAGGLVILGLILFFVLRKRWPAWRRKIQFKIFEALMKDDPTNGNSSDKDIINKIEDPTSTSSIDLDSRGKILVTEDMEENAVDVSTGYMREVGLEHHPRPTITTTMGGGSGLDGFAQTVTAAEEIPVSDQANRSMAYASFSKLSPTTPSYATSLQHHHCRGHIFAHNVVRLISTASFKTPTPPNCTLPTCIYSFGFRNPVIHGCSLANPLSLHRKFTYPAFDIFQGQGGLAGSSWVLGLCTAL
ncbi:hypothetical protein EC991_011342 [Linnemannia zychae]|nr:hypothetical protein EC991_011342 [Linnemannia zychae]